MKRFGQILTVLSLAVGALSATTAYHVPLATPTAQLVGLTLRDGAGRVEGSDGKVQPLIAAGTTLTAEEVEALKQHKFDKNGSVQALDAIRVREFDFELWQQKWVFVGALGGMVVGAVLMRLGRRRSEPLGEQAAALSPGRMINEMADQLDELTTELVEVKEDAQQRKLIVGRVGEIQRQQMVTFIEAREDLVADRGLAEAAQIMDEYSLAERQINRAWSMATDGYLREAKATLQEGTDLMDRLRITWFAADRKIAAE